MKIRNIEQKDGPAVMSLIEELENMHLDWMQFESIFDEYLKRDNSFVWVLEIENQVVGFLSCFGQRLLHHQNWVYEIQEFVIRKEFQVRGFGKLMIKKLMDELNSQDVFSLEVTTNKKRIHAQAFYKACGFLNSHEKFTWYF